MVRFAALVIGFSFLVALMAPSAKGPVATAGPVVMVGGETRDDAVPSKVPVTNGPWGEVSLDRDPSGHFATNANINGQSLPFVVDTGADIVALTVDDARRIGIYVDPSRFTVIAEGASGPVKGQEVTLARVEVAGRTVENVRGAVLEGLSTNLLGQSVLTELGGVEMKGDKMVLR